MAISALVTLAFKAGTTALTLTDLGITVANLASEGQALYPDIGVAKQRYEELYQQIPELEDNYASLVDSGNVESQTIIGSLEKNKEVYSDFEYIVENLNDEINNYLTDNALNDVEDIAFQDEQGGSVEVQRNMPLHVALGVLKAADVASEIYTVAKNVRDIYHIFKDSRAAYQIVKNADPRLRRVLVGSERAKFVIVAKPMTRTELLGNILRGAIAGTSIGLNFYMASKTSESTWAAVAAMEENKDALDEQIDIQKERHEILGEIKNWDVCWFRKNMSAMLDAFYLSPLRTEMENRLVSTGVVQPQQSCQLIFDDFNAKVSPEEAIPYTTNDYMSRVDFDSMVASQESLRDYFKQQKEVIYNLFINQAGNLATLLGNIQLVKFGFCDFKAPASTIASLNNLPLQDVEAMIAPMDCSQPQSIIKAQVAHCMTGVKADDLTAQITDLSLDDLDAAIETANCSE